MIEGLKKQLVWRLGKRMRQRSFVLPESTVWSSMRAFLDLFRGRSALLEQKLNQLALDLSFVRSHMGVYLGNGIALTYLPDERPIFVNSDDFGSPMNMLNGGVYEQDNLEVLLSFIKSGSTAVDVGANLGFFCLRFAERVRWHGRAIAFEPQPFLFDLLDRTMFLNGFRETVTAYPFGLSDSERIAAISHPERHLGGGHVVPEGASGAVPITLRRLDDVLPPGTAVDVVKIDVEEHELAVLRGMQRVVRESPFIAILIEKLAPSAGYETEMAELLQKHGLALFAVEHPSRLKPIDLQGFEQLSGYVLATRAGKDFQLDRAFFALYPEQLRISALESHKNEQEGLMLAGDNGVALFHGPYWWLDRGHWSIRIEGTLKGRIRLVIAERHTRPVLELEFRDGLPEKLFFVDHALMQFSVVAMVISRRAELQLHRIVLTRSTDQAVYHRFFASGKKS